MTVQCRGHRCPRHGGPWSHGWRCASPFAMLCALCWAWSMIATGANRERTERFALREIERGGAELLDEAAA